MPKGLPKREFINRLQSEIEKLNKEYLDRGTNYVLVGPWAGPVVAGAVIFPNLEISDSLAANLNDSKLSVRFGS